MPSLLRRELVAVLGMLGVALTVLGRIDHFLPLAGWLGRLARAWAAISQALWRPPFELLRIELHPDLAAGLMLSWFMALIGLGAALSLRWRNPGTTIGSTWSQQDHRLKSIVVFVALLFVFLFGQDQRSGAAKLQVNGSEGLGRFVFGCVTAAGFIVGEAIGGAEFRLRLLRMAALVLGLVGLSAALRQGAGWL